VLFSHRLRDVLAHKTTPRLMLVMMLIMTGAAWVLTKHLIDDIVDQRFRFHTERAASAIAKRLLEYETVLRSGVGLFDASGTIERDDWRVFVTSLNLKKSFPGIQGLGFSQVVLPADLTRHLEETRRHGLPDYTIRPYGPRELYTGIVFLEPANEANQRAFGLDLFADLDHERAMRHAIDTGELALSRQYILEQDSGQADQPGLVMYMPVYLRGMPTATVAERRQAILGFLFATLRIKDFMADIRSGDHDQITMALYAGGTNSPDALLYTSPASVAGGPPAFLMQHLPQGQARIPSPLVDWVLRVQAQPGFVSWLEAWQPHRVALASLVVDLFLFLLIRSVSQRKQSLELQEQLLKSQLRESEERYGALFRSTAQPTLVIAPGSGAILDSNPAAQAYYDLDDGQMKALTIGDLTPLAPTDLAPPYNAAGQAQRTDFPFRHPDGSLRQIELSYGTFHHRGDQAFYAIIEDVTERKAWEHTLIAERQRLANVLSGTACGTWEWDIQDGSTEFNERWAEMLGYSLEELTPVSLNTWLTLTHPEDLVRAREILDRHFSGELPGYECELRMRHKDGHWVWILDCGKVVRRTADGHPLTMYGIHLDISARKAAEQQVHEKEALLRSAIEAIGEAFVVFDPEDRIAFHNEKYREVYHLSSPAIEIGRSFEEILRYGVDRGQYPEAIGREEEWIATRMEQHHRGGHELIQNLPDGRWMKIREQKTPSGHCVGFRVDITELYRAKQAAEAANLAKSRFLATMSHEIRTPMNGILGMTQVLLMPDLSAAERQECAQTILRSGTNLLSLLNDLLDLSKVEAGKLELQCVPVSPLGLLQEIHDLFAPPAMFKHLRLTLDSDLAAEQRFMADPVRLRQMLANLVGNAIKFTQAGEIRIGVHRISAAGAEGLEFSVSDTGIGIPADKQTALFEPFSQVDDSPTRQFDGSGLGLSIVRQLATLMGGTAGVESTTGQGSRFWFTTDSPAAESAGTGATDSPEEPATAVKPTVPERLHGHVLVVEDDPIHRMVILSALSKLGLSARAAGNGREAVAIVHSGEPCDAILMDLVMPEVDGHQATRQIRHWEKAGQRPRTPILAISADAFETDRQNSRASGMDDFLAKPINFDDLARTLGRWLPAEGAPRENPPLARPQTALDIGEALALLRAMQPLLQENKFDAFAYFKKLRVAVADTHLAGEVEEIGQLLSRMAFDQSSLRCAQLALTLEKELAS